MKVQWLRLFFLLSGVFLLTWGFFPGGLKQPAPAAAYAPLNLDVEHWIINEIFICGDGSEQFIELRNPTNFNQEFEFDEEQLIAKNLAGTQSRTFEFVGDVNPPTGQKHMLVATDGFSSLPGGRTPDYILPDNFLFTGGGSLSFVPNAADSVSYGAGQLPADGINSLHRQGSALVSGPNSPTNYAGQAGSVSCPPKPILAVSKTADTASGIVEAGAVLTYTITVFNSGSTAATSAVLTDTVPVSTTYVPNSASNGGTFSGGVVNWSNLTINPATNITRTFRVTVSAALATGKKITNTAYITSSQGVSSTGLNVVTVGEAIIRRFYLPLIYKK